MSRANAGLNLTDTHSPLGLSGRGFNRSHKCTSTPAIPLRVARTVAQRCGLYAPFRRSADYQNCRRSSVACVEFRLQRRLDPKSWKWPSYKSFFLIAQTAKLPTGDNRSGFALSRIRAGVETGGSPDACQGLLYPQKRTWRPPSRYSPVAIGFDPSYSRCRRK